MATAIGASLAYLSNHVSSNGRFDYIYDPRFGRCVSRRYNLLRHAGTTMVLYRAAGSKFDGGEIRRIAELALSYLRRFFVPAGYGGRSCFYLADDRYAKLGGTALALLALVARVDCSPSEQDMLLVQRMARYIASQQKGDGRFASKIDRLTGQEMPFQSSYYSGQSVVALCDAYRITGDTELLERSVSGVRYLAKEHLANPPTATGFTDHWAMLGLCALQKATDDQWYAEQLRFLSEPLIAAAEGGAVSWLDDEHTTRISTRLEGLIAALEVELRLGERKRTARLLRIILNGLSRCYARQVGSPHLSQWSDDPRACGGFVRSFAQPLIRIDYVQHALSASLEMVKVLSRPRNAGKKHAGVRF